MNGSADAITWTPTGGFAYTSSVEIYVGAISGFRYNLNGGGWNTATINSWNTVATGSGTINTLSVDRGGSATHGWHAIKVDGVILEDIPDYVKYSISTDTSARYLWSSNDGEHWSHSGFNNDTASATIKVKTRYLGWASGSNSSTTTVSGAYPDSVHWFQPYGQTANKLRLFRFYGTNAPPGSVDGKTHSTSSITQ